MLVRNLTAKSTFIFDKIKFVNIVGLPVLIHPGILKRTGRVNMADMASICVEESELRTVLICVLYGDEREYRSKLVTFLFPLKRTGSCLIEKSHLYRILSVEIFGGKKVLCVEIL